MGGIKRFGTVISRRKSTVPPQSTPEKPKGKPSRFPFRRGDSSRSFQEVDSPSGQALTPVASHEPEPPTQSQYVREDMYSPGETITRADTNGLMSSNDPSDIPITNGSNMMDVPNTGAVMPPARQVSQIRDFLDCTKFSNRCPKSSVPRSRHLYRRKANLKALPPRWMPSAVHKKRPELQIRTCKQRYIAKIAKADLLQ